MPRKELMMRRPALALCLLVLFAMAVQPSRSQNLVPRDIGFMGMVVRDPHYEWKTNSQFNGANQAFYDAMGERLATLGVRWVRFEMRAEDGIAYDKNDPEEGLRLAQYDYFVNEVAPRHNLKVIALLATNLARDGNYIDPEQIERNDQETSECWNYKYGCGTNTYMRIWLDRAFAIAKRYEGRIAAYEIMNEENRYINGGGKGISPGKMATLMTKFYRIFRNGGPDGSFGDWRNDVKLVLGGIHPDRCDDCAPGGMNDRQYLDAIYKSSPFQDFRNANGGTYPLDGVAYHPYPMEMRSGLIPEPTGLQDLYRVPARMLAMRDVMLRNGDSANKIWVTEIGDRGDPYDQENQVRQSEFMRTIYWMLWQRRDFVENVLWFKYEDFAVQQGTENWGVVRLVPRTPSTQCGSCEYAPDGAVEMLKDSFFSYTDIARFGSYLQVEKVYIPLVRK
jgi:hypothetical protein